MKTLLITFLFLIVNVSCFSQDRKSSIVKKPNLPFVTIAGKTGGEISLLGLQNANKISPGGKYIVKSFSFYRTCKDEHLVFVSSDSDKFTETMKSVIKKAKPGCKLLFEVHFELENGEKKSNAQTFVIK